jgi:hypothetical protein
MRAPSILLGALSLIAIPVLAQAGGFSPESSALEVANNSGVCGELGVLDATLQADGTVAVVCNEDPTAFLPLAGGLGPLLGLGAAAAVVGIAASSDDNGATSDTQ